MTVIYKTGSVTLEDVREAIAQNNLDPRTASSNKVREFLNRGSFSTIAEHIKTLRAELKAAETPAATQTQAPAAPTELVTQLWGAAWNAAQLASLLRTEKLSTERDNALEELAVLKADHEAALTEIQSQEGKLIAAEAATQQAEAQYQAERAQAQEDRHRASTDYDNLKSENEALRLQLESERREAKHAAEVAEARQSGMQVQIQTLTEQVTELKARLYSYAPGNQPDAGSPAP